MTERVVKLARLALFLALATVIHTAEGLLPVTIVWFRFGFANIISLAALELFGFKAALLVTLGRIFLGSIGFGMFGSPAFILSLAGGLSAILAMAVVYRLGRGEPARRPHPAQAGKPDEPVPRGTFSEIGISVVGAVAHNTAQLAVAYLLLIRNEAILLLLPLMLLTAAVTGFLNGLAARFFIRHFRKVTKLP